MKKKYPLKYGCFKYFLFSMALFALINLLRVAEPAICHATHLCANRLPDWLWPASMSLAIVGLVMFIVKAYRDLFRQEESLDDRAADIQGMQKRKTMRET
ncbi:hypothetical protein [Undibacterium sp.]|uniref:hypothetical protein n=1 Tax=Undibacterium sp. TaxID=1914977 RepID=UPI00374DD972